MFKLNLAEFVIRASMGPHSFERGNLGVLGLSSRNQQSFNGASLFRARKLKLMLIQYVSDLASMGPHSFERGNITLTSRICFSLTTLQWGLTLSSEETQLR